MPLASVLLFAILFSASPSTAAQPPASDGTISPAVSSAAAGLTESTLPQASSAHRPSGLDSPDDVCYKIRAYIFKRDDDHAPQFVRSTTCGPRTPRLKKSERQGARVVPAN